MADEEHDFEWARKLKIIHRMREAMIAELGEGCVGFVFDVAFEDGTSMLADMIRSEYVDPECPHESRAKLHEVVRRDVEDLVQGAAQCIEMRVRRGGKDEEVLKS